MVIARLGSVCTISRAQSSRRSQSSGAVALNSSTSRPRTACRQRLERFGRRIDDEEMDAAASRAPARQRRRTASADFTVMRSSAKSILSARRERLRLVDADLGAGERMLAGLEDHALIGADRLVARIAFDLDKADGDARLRWRGSCARSDRRETRNQAMAASKQVATRAASLIIDDHAPGNAADGHETAAPCGCARR